MKKIKRKTAFILALLMTLSLCACEFDIRPGKEEENLGAYSHQFEWEDDKPDSIVLTQEEILEYVNESSSLWEAAQRLVGNDIILYKDALGDFAYIPVNTDLPLSDYDWDSLERLLKSYKEIEYRVDNQAVSIKGIDVSAYQGDIDWKAVAGDGVKYAFIRLGYRGYSSGKLVLDECFEENISGALQNGIAVGVYFVTQALSGAEAEEEAQFVLDTIAPYKVTWPIVLDIEATGGSHPRTESLTAAERTDYTIVFCDTIKNAGYTPMLYSNIGWYINQLELDRLAAYDKWFAQYFNRPFFPYEFQVWQYTSSGRVKGIEGNVDLNISMYDYGTGEYVPYKDSTE